jgi:hypothetical protein
MATGAENRAVTPFHPPRDADWPDVFKAFARRLKLAMRTHVPAKVLAYNPATQKAVVEVAIQQVVKVTDPARIPAGTQILKGVPPNAEAVLMPFKLVDIPVAWPRTAAGYITFKLATGDTGELHVMDRSIEQWILLGQATDPVLAFTHALKDSVFHPGLHSDIDPIVPPTSLLGTVVEGTPSILLGAAATESAVKAASLVTALVQAVTASATGSMDGGATFKANLITQLGTILAAISSNKVKVE